MVPAAIFASLADYHTHTPLCRHAEGWPVDYARVAVERGLGELGFADHNPMPEQFDDWRMLRDELPRYFEAVEEARAQFPSSGSSSGWSAISSPATNGGSRSSRAWRNGTT